MKLTIPEAATLLGANEERVRDWIEDDGLPAQRIRGQYRINRTELLEWATEHDIALRPHVFARSSVAKRWRARWLGSVRCRPRRAAPSRCRWTCGSKKRVPGCGGAHHPSPRPVDIPHCSLRKISATAWRSPTSGADDREYDTPP